MVSLVILNGRPLSLRRYAACHLDRADVCGLLAIDRALGGLEGERVLVNGYKDGGGRHLVAVGVKAGNLGRPALVLARPDGLVEAAVAFEGPRLDGVRGRMYGQDLRGGGGQVVLLTRGAAQEVRLALRHSTTMRVS